MYAQCVTGTRFIWWIERSISESELAAFNELVMRDGAGPSTAEALEALRAHLRAQLERDMYWRFKQSTAIETPWARRWNAGVWISVRTGDGARARSLRASMTASELASFDEILEHYGTRVQRP